MIPTSTREKLRELAMAYRDAITKFDRQGAVLAALRLMKECDADVILSLLDYVDELERWQEKVRKDAGTRYD